MLQRRPSIPAENTREPRSFKSSHKSIQTNLTKYKSNVWVQHAKHLALVRVQNTNSSRNEAVLIWHWAAKPLHSGGVPESVNCLMVGGLH